MPTAMPKTAARMATSRRMRLIGRPPRWHARRTSSRGLQGREEARHARPVVLPHEDPLGGAAATEVAQRPLAVLGGELAERRPAPGPNAPGRHVRALAVLLERVGQLLDPGRR